MERISEKNFLELNMSASVKFKIFYIKCNNKNYKICYNKKDIQSHYSPLSLLYMCL